jgi:cysteinyl-tRNA synthetase
MPIQLYNSLTRKVEELIPREADSLSMFVCGPTVYDRIHLGNARTFTIFDVVAKWLRYRGLTVRYIQNITDIDDKIIRRAREAGRDPLEFAHEHDDLFRADMKALGNTAVSEYLRATDFIPQVIQQVKTLRERGHAYLIEGDGWYYDLSTFPDYGKLSGRTGSAAHDAISRIDDSEKKKNAGDFCLWKLSKSGEPVWHDAELGDGRPGWHIEDTAITESVFGPQYDIHGGGMDLKFPHHEAEIAQQEAASGLVPFVKYWMHAGFLETKSEKMSKSTGNITALHELLAQYDPAVIRFYLLSNHYRSPLDFDETSLNAAQAAVNRIGELARKQSTTEDFSLTNIEEAMDNDINTAAAFAAIFEIVKDANKRGVAPSASFFDFISKIFGIVPSISNDIPDDIQNLVNQRQTARDAKDFASSDKLRDELAARGYTVDDTPYGPLVKKK